jgi:membrane protease YdiL (CAAX protease family)
MSARRLVRRFPLTSFFLLACLVGWNPYIRNFLTGGPGAENFPLGPLVATVIVLSCQGREELRSWSRRLRSWRAAPRWYLLAVLAPLSISVLIVVMNRAWGAPWPTSDQLAEWPQVLVTFIAMLIFVGIGEEAGWMLFAAPILLRRHGFLVACALSSAMRILWHLPMMLDGGLAWYLGTVGNAGFTLVMLLVLRASKGRWWLVAVWHAALNATGGLFFFRMVTGDDKARLGYLLGSVYLIVGVAGYLVWRRHLARHEAESSLVPHDQLQHSTSGGRHDA